MEKAFREGNKKKKRMLSVFVFVFGPNVDSISTQAAASGAGQGAQASQAGLRIPHGAQTSPSRTLASKAPHLWWTALRVCFPGKRLGFRN